jgi:glycosidase
MIKPMLKKNTWLSLLVTFVLLAGCVQTAAPAATQTAPPSQAAAAVTNTPSAPTATPTPDLPPTAQPGALTDLQPGWWNDAVFYEIFVRSFKDSNGDGIGDFNGITASLDYLNDGDPSTTTDLGITALWLMPINQSPSYHGYDVIDYYQVEQDYGTKEDFLRLIDEAHKRGIHVIIDMVINHTGLDHPWFQASDAGDPKYRDWYIWQPEKPSYLGPWGEQVWYKGKSGFYYAVFWSGMPDLNLENPEVTAEIYKITDFWLKDMNVDGFRLDAIRHYVEQGKVQENSPATHAWLQAFHTFYKSLDPSIYTIGEAWTNTANVVDYIGDEVDSAFEFDLAAAFVRTAKGPIASSATKQMKTVLDAYPKNQYGVFLTNHDQDRVMSALGGDVTKAKLAAAMQLTSPGIPFLYYGEEIGMTGVKPDEDIRRPMQWTGQAPGVGFTTGQPWRMPPDDFSTTNVEDQSADPNSLLSFYRQLIHLRMAHSALRNGDSMVVDTGTQLLYAILRYDENEVFLILINPDRDALKAEKYGLTITSGPFKGPVTITAILGQQGAEAPQINAAGGFENYHPLAEIPPFSAVILQLNR